jgi:hypothetical protein
MGIIFSLMFSCCYSDKNTIIQPLAEVCSLFCLSSFPPAFSAGQLDGLSAEKEGENAGHQVRHDLRRATNRHLPSSVEIFLQPH